MKRVLAILLCLALFLLSAATVYATEDESTSATIPGIDTLLPCINALIADRESFGIGVEELANLYVGFPVQAYEVRTNGGLQKTDFEIYPVFSDQRMLGEIIKTDEGTTQFSRMFYEVFSECEDLAVAVVYDNEHTYLIDRDTGNAQIVYSYSYRNDRGTLTNAGQLAASEEIQWTEVERWSIVFQANQAVQPAADGVYPVIVLPTGVVLQSDTYLCWAACVACIGNYLTSISHSAEYVAQQYPAGYNQPAQLSTSVGFLSALYGQSYFNTDKHNAPTDTLIHDNLSAGYPLFGRWTDGGIDWHQTVIRGINVSSGWLYVMDPRSGYITANKTNGVFRYVTSEGDTLTLVGYAAQQ